MGMGKEPIVYHFHSWNWDLFTYIDPKSEFAIEFHASYRSKLKPQMTIAEIRVQGCIIVSEDEE